MGQGDGVTVGHGDGDERCRYLSIGIRCLDGHVVAGADRVGGEKW